MYQSSCDSPLGPLLLTADENGLTGLWFRQAQGQMQAELPVFAETRRWLDLYFSGRDPGFLPPLHLSGSPFQKQVWEILLTIPYGQVLTYGQIARRISPRLSAQAVGGAVGRNPVSILVPCHRVVGAGGNLTGYASGLDRKIALLTLEGLDMGQFHLPKAK